MFNKKYILALLLAVFLVVEIPIIAVGELSKPAPADVIIILGARLIGAEPSTMLRLRLDDAIRLYHQGYAPNIIVSGAKGKDETVAEAFAMRDYLLKKDIPGKRIFTETASYNTYQNLANSQAIMNQHGYKKALIVSNASHICRALVLAKLLHLSASADPAPMPDNLYLTTKQYLREGAAMLSLTADEL